MKTKRTTVQDVLDILAKVGEKLDAHAALLTKQSEQNEEIKLNFDKQIKVINRKIADLGDTLGEFAEGQVKPRIISLFRKRGIELEDICEHVKIEKEGKLYLEIDLMLVNTEYMIILEVKNTLREKHIDEHLRRFEKLKNYTPNFMKNYRLIGAVAGMVISESVEKYAFKRGFFVIKPRGNNVIISNKKDFQFKEWKFF